MKSKSSWLAYLALVFGAIAAAALVTASAFGGDGTSVYVTLGVIAAVLAGAAGAAALWMRRSSS